MYCRHALVWVILLLLGTPIASAQSQKSPEQKQPTTVFELSEVDHPPRAIRKTEPRYPAAAKRKNIQGSVTLRFTVTKKGRVINPSVVKGHPPGVFDRSALKAISSWRFKPAIKGREPVDVVIVAALKFELVDREFRGF
ncbi:MAG: energy transducer TonB [Desulfobacterales bacterium]